MTLVSIVTPSYNQAAFLPQTLRSVLDQGYPALEYIVVDGGSTDGSIDIIRQNADRLAWWVSEPDAGQADALNRGFAHAHGHIAAWLNSDDYYLPGALSAAVGVFESHQDVVLVYGDVLAVDAEDQTINTLRYRQYSLEDLLRFQIIGQPAVFMRRDALEAVGGLNRDLHFLLDHELWIRLARYGRILHVEQTWAAARFHAAAKNRAQAPRFGEEAFRILELAAKDPKLAPVLLGIDRAARASAFRVKARYLLDGGQPRRAIMAWFRALSIDPPIALSRSNILMSALLEAAGLGPLRQALLRYRQARLSR